MKILSVELFNFGPFHAGPHKFNLADRGLLLVMGDNQDEPRMDSNGAGKSSIFDGLDWCLWGDNPRGDHADAVVNDEAFAQRGAKCSVQVSLVTDAGVAIEIIRSRTKSKNELTLDVAGEDKGTLDTKETQKMVEKYLGLDRDVFHAAVLFAQTDLVHYADATDGEKMAILTKILQLDELDLCLAAAKARVKANDEAKASFQMELATLAGRIQGLRPEDSDVQIDQWQRDYEVTAARLGEQLRVQGEAYYQAKAEIHDPESFKVRRMDITQAMATLGEAPVEGSEIEQARQVAEKAQQDAAVGAQECVRLEAQLIRVQGQREGVCSQCGQQITGEHLQNEVQKAREALQEAANRQSPIQAWLLEAEALRKAAKERHHESYRQWQAWRDTYQKDLAELDSQLAVISLHVSRVAGMEDALAGIQRELDWHKSTLNPFLEQKNQAEKERYDLERKRGQLQYQVGDLVIQARYLDFWVKGFGPQGLKSYILDSRLQELSDAANEWLSMLTGGTIWVRFEAQKQQRSKKLVNAPDIRVFRWNPDGTITERSYKSWSGGEKKRISFAVDFGLSRLVARRAKQTYDLLILDEAFKHLDRAGKEAVVDMLQVLGQEKSSLIVVEHDTEFQGQFEQRVLVTKRNRRSRLFTIEDPDYATKKEEKELSSNLPADSPRKPIPRRQPIRRPISRNG